MLHSEDHTALGSEPLRLQRVTARFTVAGRELPDSPAAFYPARRAKSRPGASRCRLSRKLKNGVEHTFFTGPLWVHRA